MHTQTSNPQVSAFTLVELLVSIGIIAILGSIAFPFVSQGIARASLTQCSSNLRQIGMSLQSYVTDNDGTLPGPLFSNQKGSYKIDESGQMFSYLAPYLDLPPPTSKRQRAEKFHCPAWKRTAPNPKSDDATVYTLSSSSDGAPDGAPFGYPALTGADGSSKAAKPPLRLSQLVNRSQNQAIRDVIFDKKANTGPHEAYRNVLFLDWHVETILMEPSPK